MKAMLSAKLLVTSDGLIESPLITVEDGTITSIERRESTAASITHDFGESTLTSGFFARYVSRFRAASAIIAAQRVCFAGRERAEAT